MSLPAVKTQTRRSFDVQGRLQAAVAAASLGLLYATLTPARSKLSSRKPDPRVSRHRVSWLKGGPIPSTRGQYRPKLTRERIKALNVARARRIQAA